MMKILVVDEFGNAEKILSDFVPRIGDKVDVFCTPIPTVTEVWAWPTKERLAELGSHYQDLDVIITVN